MPNEYLLMAVSVAPSEAAESYRRMLGTVPLEFAGNDDRCPWFVRSR
jgi:hypothetical protein